MRIESDWVGTRLLPLETVIAPRQAANYAAAVGETNPCYFDDTCPEEMIAHPVFPVALTWPITMNLKHHIPDAQFPLDLLAMQVHHTEEIELHGPIQPGRSLVIDGTVAAIVPHRAGTRVILRYAARDQNQQRVFTEYVGGLLRGVQCVDGGRSLPGIPAAAPADLPGDPLWEQPLDIDPGLPYLYDGCSDIVFPIHTSPAFAQAVGLPGIILQGTATLALAVRELLKRESDINPALVTRLACRFTGMVLPGSSIAVRLRSRSASDGKVALTFDVVDHEGNAVLRKGRIDCRSENRGERGT